MVNVQNFHVNFITMRRQQFMPVAISTGKGENYNMPLSRTLRFALQTSHIPRTLGISLYQTYKILRTLENSKFLSEKFCLSGRLPQIAFGNFFYLQNVIRNLIWNENKIKRFIKSKHSFMKGGNKK